MGRTWWHFPWRGHGRGGGRLEGGEQCGVLAVSAPLTFDPAPSIFFSILCFPPYPVLSTIVPLLPEASQRLNPTFPPRITDKYMKHKCDFYFTDGETEVCRKEVPCSRSPRASGAILDSTSVDLLPPLNMQGCAVVSKGAKFPGWNSNSILHEPGELGQ